MNKKEFLLHFMYIVAIVVLFNASIMMIANHAKFGNIGNILLFGGVGGAALVLGLFTFQKSLSYGLTLAGTWCSGQILYYYKVNLTDAVRFGVALLMLGIVLYALYVLRQKQSK